MMDLKNGLEFSPEYCLRLGKRFWLLMVAGLLLGVILAALYGWITPPLYRSQLRFFTWNQTVADAAREIGESVKNEGNQTQAVIMYNNLISQSMIIGQSLVNDYKQLLSNPSVSDKVREKLGKDAHYTLSLKSERQSCIIIIEAISSSPETAEKAANTTMEVFQEEQQRLMGVRFASMIQPASLPSKPFFPVWKRLLAIGALLGFLVGLGIAIVWDYWDFSFKNADDVENLGVLCLGEITQCRDLNTRLNLNSTAPLDHRARVLNDELTTIKTNLHHRNIDNPQRSIMITSDIPAVGKSSTVIMLAQMLADPENKVLLIDGDLRKASLSSKLNCFPPEGLVQCLLAMGKAEEPAKFIVPTSFPQIDFLSHGDFPRRPPDFFSSKQFPMLLEKLKAHYQYVIIDAPPAIPMVDAFLIAKHTDGIIFIAKNGVSRIDVYKRLVKDWQCMSEKVLGMILTFAPNRSNSYYYYGEKK